LHCHIERETSVRRFTQAEFLPWPAAANGSK
jgi:hypothetical protein